MTRVPDWTELGLRQIAAEMSARTRVTTLSPLLGAMVAEVAGDGAQPFRGIDVPSTRGPLAPAAPTDTTPIVDAGLALLAALDTDQQARLVLPFDAPEKRQWFNVHPNVLRHGLLLEDLDAAQRDAAVHLMATTLSARGLAQARDVMRINGLLVEVTGRPDEFGEWPYFVSFFGEPGGAEPWAWQVDGHHLNVNACVVDGYLSITPTFMGSEPCTVATGALAGTNVFVDEAAGGLSFMRALDGAQLARARVAPSILRGDLPVELSHVIDGRMVAGAFKDNASVEHGGIRGDELTDAQRGLLRRVIATYVGWARDDHAGVRMDLVDRHLDETSFVWMGSLDDGPFYYRVLSPVVLVEFDHHPGIVFDNLEPSRHHIHTVLRTPNGGDYGHDVLARHHDRFDHSGGSHEPRQR